jgi:hypothetical protein
MKTISLLAATLATGAATAVASAPLQTGFSLLALVTGLAGCALTGIMLGLTVRSMVSI